MFLGSIRLPESVVVLLFVCSCGFEVSGCPFFWGGMFVSLLVWVLVLEGRLPPKVMAGCTGSGNLPKVGLYLYWVEARSGVTSQPAIPCQPGLSKRLERRVPCFDYPKDDLNPGVVHFPQKKIPGLSRP